jgi:hypothetical protein
MDISELWSFCKFLLPLAAACMVYRIARRLHRRWLQVSIKTVASALFVGSVILALLVVLSSAGCTRHAPPISSPDGRHIALLRYALQGALGDDYATVELRSRWTPWAESVYSGLGNWDFKNDKPGDPEVRWLDGTHLLIRYYDDRTGKEGRGGPATCLKRIGEVQILCDPVRIPTPKR